MSNYELYKGDCLEVMANNPSILERANMILIDPPYGILNKKAKWDNIIDPSEMWNLINDNTKITVPTLVFCQEPYASLVISENIILRRLLYFIGNNLLIILKCGNQKNFLIVMFVKQK